MSFHSTHQSIQQRLFDRPLPDRPPSQLKSLQNLHHVVMEEEPDHLAKCSELQPFHRAQLEPPNSLQLQKPVGVTVRKSQSPSDKQTKRVVNTVTQAIFETGLRMPHSPGELTHRISLQSNSLLQHHLSSLLDPCLALFVPANDIFSDLFSFLNIALRPKPLGLSQTLHSFSNQTQVIQNQCISIEELAQSYPTLSLPHSNAAISCLPRPPLCLKYTYPLYLLSRSIWT
ncbi:unnamed protein product [Protopolystoma xenopodis]|uniref:Uncharacterized protein n=1 Tax=Protopolystoma xenopodis TaxID=117903 RepID=A0A3S5AC56_9PLAT|nr:unnamed protein product [Protopolystoma xenopodis]